MLGDAQPTAVLDWHGWKVGLVGLAEEEWLATLATLDVEQLRYTSFVEEGRRRALELRVSYGPGRGRGGGWEQEVRKQGG
jgi:5'-nucleotidase